MKFDYQNSRFGIVFSMKGIHSDFSKKIPVLSCSKDNFQYRKISFWKVAINEYFNVWTFSLLHLRYFAFPKSLAFNLDNIRKKKPEYIRVSIPCQIFGLCKTCLCRFEIEDYKFLAIQRRMWYTLGNPKKSSSRLHASTYWFINICRHPLGSN